MFKKENRIIFLFFCFFKKLVISYVVLPFNIKKKSINLTLPIEEQIEYYLEKNSIITTISFGEKPKQLELYLTLNEYALSLSNDACLEDASSSYNPLLSKSFKNTTDYMDLLVDIKKYYRAIDKCSFYNNIYLNNNISISNLSFLFHEDAFPNESDNSNQICGNLGLQIFNEKGAQFKHDYFINSLIQSNIINEYTWSILYLNNTVNENDILNYTNKDFDGILICGINENDYKSIFKTNNIKTIKAGTRSSSIYWDITDLKINYEFPENKTNNYESFDNRITFNNEINYITCTESFFNSIKNSFFNEFLQKNICTIIEKIKPMGSYVIICEKDFKDKMSTFPKILFYHNELDFSFELTYKDLFVEYNNKLLFLIIYNAYGQNLWSVGKIFMEKYPIIFDYDKKTISFVNINIINKSNNNKEKADNGKPIIFYLKIIIIALLIIFIIIIIILIVKVIWIKKRGEISDELDNDYNSENLKEEDSNNNALYDE
jgi:hypothetical protein